MFLGLSDPDPLVRGMDPDPDPHVFGPLGSVSISQMYGMDPDPDPSFIKQKIGRKTLIPTVLRLLLNFFL